MDEQRFDQLSRALARGANRRGVLKGMVGVLGGALGLGVTRSVGVARTRAANGAGCSSPRDCASGLCVDGVCCDSGCSGTCEACNVSGAEGRCSPVEGAPVGHRGPCPGDGSICSGVCDGVTTSSCGGYSGNETVCGDASCQGDYLISQVCSGNGVCIAAPSYCGEEEGLTCLSGACVSACEPCGDACCGADELCCEGEEAVCMAEIEGAMVCSGSGFCTVANGAGVYRECAQGTQCRPDNAAQIVCDNPG